MEDYIANVEKNKNIKEECMSKHGKKVLNMNARKIIYTRIRIAKLKKIVRINLTNK